MGPFHALVERIRRTIAFHWRGFVTEQAVDVRHQLAAEAPLQPCARQGQQLPQRTDAHRQQRWRHAIGQSCTHDIHERQRTTQRRRIHHRHAVFHAGQHIGGLRRRRQRDAMTKTQAGEVLAQQRLETRPRTEQVETATDLQHDRMRQQPYVAAIAIRPGREQSMPMRFVARIVLDHGEGRQQRLRRGQPLPAIDACRARRSIGCVHDAPLRRTTHQHQRLVRRRTASEDTVQCQVRQQNAGPQHDGAPSRPTGSQRDGLRWRIAATALAHVHAWRRFAFQFQSQGSG